MDKKKKLETELLMLGINNETELKEAIAKLSPLNLYMLTATSELLVCK